MKTETIFEISKAAPPVSVGTLTVFGYSLNEVVLILTAIYTIFLLVDKFPSVVSRLKAGAKWVKEKLDDKGK